MTKMPTIKFKHILPLLLTMPTTARNFHYLGCFGDMYDLENIGSSPFMAVGLCKIQCEGRGDTIMGLSNRTDCYCGNSYPTWEDELDSRRV
ncbi:uncharacterized protein BDV17DRAFT_253099 [Aspergillus undulatus]|uniref:uncharacterized protein n=1 Tax=Aspergillus undulatus TaxID=1810928 RepID=UPI003CCCD823